MAAEVTGLRKMEVEGSTQLSPRWGPHQYLGNEGRPGRSPLAAAVEQESLNAHIAEKIYLARREAKLTQKQLAEKVGTHQSVIARLESADYTGHSLDMLKRIAEAVGKRVRVDFSAAAK